MTLSVIDKGINDPLVFLVIVWIGCMIAGVWLEYLRGGKR